MNGKKAKALRRLAEDKTLGLQDRELIVVRDQHGYKKTVNATNTTRAVYRDLKKSA